MARPVSTRGRGSNAADIEAATITRFAEHAVIGEGRAAQGHAVYRAAGPSTPRGPRTRLRAAGIAGRVGGGRRLGGLRQSRPSRGLLRLGVLGSSAEPLASMVVRCGLPGSPTAIAARSPAGPAITRTENTGGTSPCGRMAADGWQRQRLAAICAPLTVLGSNYVSRNGKVRPPHARLNVVGRQSTPSPVALAAERFAGSDVPSFESPFPQPRPPLDAPSRRRKHTPQRQGPATVPSTGPGRGRAAEGATGWPAPHGPLS